MEAAEFVPAERFAHLMLRPRELSALCLLFGATAWGLAWYPYRVLETRGIGGIEALLWTYLAAIAVTTALLPRAWAELRDRPGWGLAIAAAAGFTNIAYVLAVLRGDVLRVLLMFYLAPLWTVPLARLILRERLDRSAAAAIACALAGAAATLWRPDSGYPLPDSAPDWLALSAGFAFALTNVTTRAAAALGDGAKVLAPSLGVVLLALPWLAFHRSPELADGRSGGTLAIIVATGVLLAAIAAAVQYGVTHMRANRAIVVMLFEIVVGAASSTLIAGERVTGSEVAGGLLIAGASLFAVRERRG